MHNSACGGREIQKLKLKPGAFLPLTGWICLLLHVQSTCPTSTVVSEVLMSKTRLIGAVMYPARITEKTDPQIMRRDVVPIP
jgi:hypothetical protein